MSELPVKVYRTRDRLTVAAPTPGLLAEDIRLEVTAENHLVIQGEPRGATAERQVYNRLVQRDGSTAASQEQEEWRRLQDEWNVGPYQRELVLPTRVNAMLATATYGNGVVVITLPVAEHTSPAVLHLESLGMGHGERVGSTGFPIQPLAADAHRAAKSRLQAAHHGHRDPHDR